jgi:hypothetical protein
MELANLLIYHGTELCSSNKPEDVRDINDKAIAEARKFIGRVCCNINENSDIIRPKALPERKT